MNKVYELVTQKIIDEMQKGIIPWARPWQGGIFQPVNWKTGRPYQGINRLLLPPGEYATFNQIKKAGGKVKKGEKAHIVTFWKLSEVKRTDIREHEEIEETEVIQTAEEVLDTGTVKIIPILRYYHVFEINTQCEGLESRHQFNLIKHEPIREAEKIIHGYIDKPKMREDSSAYYKPSTDELFMPPMERFYEAEEYYKVFFHEMIHSTGHSKRLNRSSITGSVAFGSKAYSQEELIAELGASFLAAEAGLNFSIKNSAAYIQNWIKVLKNDMRMVVYAAIAAEKATNYILGRS